MIRVHYVAVVIAQVQEVTDWLREAATTGVPAFSPRFTEQQNKAAWQRRLDSVLVDCSRLIADGGADYDGPRVRGGVWLGRGVPRCRSLPLSRAGSLLHR